MSSGQAKYCAAAREDGFETRDFYLACFLRCTGYELLDLRAEGRRKVFVFRDRPSRRDDVLSHLFQHQTHHRGQVHGMLSASSVKPPQLDEFIVGDDQPARAEDMALLGWSEEYLMR